MGNDISINEVEAKAFSELFNSIESDVSMVYLDSPDVIPERFGVRFCMYSTRAHQSRRSEVRARRRVSNTPG